jgi:hypothetical protein
MVKLQFYHCIFHSVHSYHVPSLLMAWYQFWWDVDTLNCPQTSSQSHSSTNGGTVFHSQPRREIDNESFVWPIRVLLFFAPHNGDADNVNTLGFGPGEETNPQLYFIWVLIGYGWTYFKFLIQRLRFIGYSRMNDQIVFFFFFQQHRSLFLFFSTARISFFFFHSFEMRVTWLTW